jgi:hypothetical protein
MTRTCFVTIVFTFLTLIASGDTIETNDGLSVSVDGNEIGSLKIDGRDVRLLEQRPMVRLRDAGEAAGFSKSLAQLALAPRISSAGNHLEISGTLVDRSGKDRCVDLWVGLPIDKHGFVLGCGLMPPKYATEKKRGKSRDPNIDTSESTDDARYPLFAAGNSSTGAGLSIAIPPAMPTRFVGGLDGNGLGVIIRIGLSPHTSPPSQTKFSVLVYRHDPAWGFRSSLERYYDFYRERFFTRRVKKIGAWTSQNPSQLREKDLYAYHEAGFATWKTPGGTSSGENVRLTTEKLDEGPICASLEEYEKLCELVEDRRLGIYALPYTIVGQRQILQLPSLPRSRDEAMNVLETWSTTQPILFDGPPQAVSFRSGEQLKRIIRDSGIHDEQHQLSFMARPYRGATLTFPQNPNPKLFDDQPDKETIAKYTLDDYLPKMFRSQWVDGCYVDSLGRWCGFYNYRAEHFRYTTLPLTYAGSPPQPCIWNLQSHAEYLWELQSRLHKQNKIVLANGVHPDRVMLGFALDVMGEEGTRTVDAGEAFAALRVAAGPKPYCLLNATGKNSPKLWASCLYMGYLLNCNTEAGAPLMRKYLPTIIRMSEAGWQPVTHARWRDENIGIERWGGGSEKPLYFSLMNLADRSTTAEISIDTKALCLPRAAKVTDDVSGESITAPMDDGMLKLSLRVEAESSRVLRVATGE